MELYIDIAKSEHHTFLSQEENNEGKKWSYSYVYFLEDLKLVYNLLCDDATRTIPHLLNTCNSHNIISKSGKKWTNRNLLEIVNALKNFGLISIDENKPINVNLFGNKEDELTEQDVRIFKDIYISYFRFREFHQLFIDSEQQPSLDILYNESNPIYSFSSYGRFVNSFMIDCDNYERIIEIDKKDSEIMRFWDVYIKWGETLGLIEKFPLKAWGIHFIPSVKSLNIVYYKKLMPRNYSIFDFIDNEYQTEYIYIPDIIKLLITKERFALKDIKSKLIDECIKMSHRYRAQSTSAIFVQKKKISYFR
ncbi:hypothetical protein NXW27_18000 [Phocaeicola dorei]|nr:hypothetical protein [Phocaeicola dorei]